MASDIIILLILLSHIKALLRTSLTVQTAFKRRFLRHRVRNRVETLLGCLSLKKREVLFIPFLGHRIRNRVETLLGCLS